MKNKIITGHREAWKIILGRVDKINQVKKNKVVKIFNGREATIIKNFDNSIKPPSDNRGENQALYEKHKEIQEKKLGKALKDLRRKSAAMLT